MADGLAPTIKGGTAKLTAKAAGYMELAGAIKDGACTIVNVPAGISKDLGCCNQFQLKSGKPKQFRCGTCKFED